MERDVAYATTVERPGSVWLPPTQRVPLRAVIVSFAALLAPTASTVYPPAALAEYDLLLWLLAVIPAFLLAYYRGWRGAATALAFGMAALSCAEVLLLMTGRQAVDPRVMVQLVGIYVVVCLGVGVLAEHLIRERRMAEALALTDTLTGLPNRRHMDVVLAARFESAKRGQPLALVLYDVDHFKAYNDVHGHAAGDEALRTFGGILSRTTNPFDFSARFGGEEFVSIVTPRLGGGVMAFVDRVAHALRRDAPPAGPVTLSIGIAHYAPEMRSAEDLIAAADAALYRAKQAGRSCVRVHAPEAVAALPEHRECA